MSRRNSDNNSILQALLDLQDTGQGERTINEMIAHLDGNPTLRRKLQDKWDGHTYNDSLLPFAMLYQDSRLMYLSPYACKVLLLLIMYVNQSGLIQVSVPVLGAICGAKRTKTNEALRELVEAGVIAVMRASTRHEAPIYMINPEIALRGKQASRKRHLYRRIAGSLDNLPEGMDIRTEVVSVKGEDDEPGYRFTRVSLETEKEPAVSDTADPVIAKAVKLHDNDTVRDNN